jgi:hypothetical protein
MLHSTAQHMVLVTCRLGMHEQQGAVAADTAGAVAAER